MGFYSPRLEGHFSWLQIRGAPMKTTLAPSVWGSCAANSRSQAPRPNPLFQRFLVVLSWCVCVCFFLDLYSHEQLQNLSSFSSKCNLRFWGQHGTWEVKLFLSQLRVVTGWQHKERFAWEWHPFFSKYPLSSCTHAMIGSCIISANISAHLSKRPSLFRPALLFQLVQLPRDVVWPGHRWRRGWGHAR